MAIKEERERHRLYWTVGKVKITCLGHSKKWHSRHSALSNQPCLFSLLLLWDSCQSLSGSSLFFPGGSSLQANHRPTSRGRNFHLLLGVLKTYILEETGEAGWILDLACSLQVRLWTFLIRNVISVSQCLIIWKVYYLFHRDLSWNLPPLTIISSTLGPWASQALGHQSSDCQKSTYNFLLP